MPRLDLKIVVHHGSVIRHRIAGREELVGSDVIVAHRLLKNHVVERLGIARLRAVQRVDCIAAMAVDPVALGMTEYRDAYDDLGEMTGLGPRPQRRRGRRSSSAAASSSRSARPATCSRASSRLPGTSSGRS